MRYTIQRVFSGADLLFRGWSFVTFDSLLREMFDNLEKKMCVPRDILYGYGNCTILMSPTFYRNFKMVSDMKKWNGVPIYVDYALCAEREDVAKVCLIYDKPEEIKMPPFENTFRDLKLYYCPDLMLPHIKEVKFNGPATIVFWRDGTKTVVKHDGKGRKDKKQAILYAFIRKIYGEGKPYHNILNEIEEAVK